IVVEIGIKKHLQRNYLVPLEVLDEADGTNTRVPVQNARYTFPTKFRARGYEIVCSWQLVQERHIHEGRFAGSEFDIFDLFVGGSGTHAARKHVRPQCVPFVLVKEEEHAPVL